MSGYKTPNRAVKVIKQVLAFSWIEVAYSKLTGCLPASDLPSSNKSDTVVASTADYCL
jgi:hypothetical protein